MPPSAGDNVRYLNAREFQLKLTADHLLVILVQHTPRTGLDYTRLAPTSRSSRYASMSWVRSKAISSSTTKQFFGSGLESLQLFFRHYTTYFHTDDIEQHHG
jgi:hypothetical protein